MSKFFIVEVSLGYQRFSVLLLVNFSLPPIAWMSRCEGYWELASRRNRVCVSLGTDKYKSDWDAEGFDRVFVFRSSIAYLLIY